MSEDNSIGRLSKAEAQVVKLTEELEEAFAGLEDHRQRSESLQRRVDALDKKAALAGKFDLKQILTMVGSSTGVAGAISGLVMFAITAEVGKVKGEVADNTEDVTEVRASLNSRGDWMRAIESRVAKAEGDAVANSASVAALEGGLTDRWTGRDQERYDDEMDDQRDRILQELDREAAINRDQEKRISRLEGGQD